MADIKELFSLKDRVAIVTGGGQGLGKSMAIGLAQAGANIVIAARRIESAMETKKEIEAIGVKCTVIKGDMRVEEDVKNMVAKVMENMERSIFCSIMRVPGEGTMQRKLLLRIGKKLSM